ncbi:unnamed protein product [Protopolystoma xenopodis]|uniref:Uncharacterized protein n=1 Tax=Protopolystoma xenopodis TaxID=117903 RepID=A0A448WF70_9PLAT|nr:unnamed protein product [Protopolystoma xenopodis]
MDGKNIPNLEDHENILCPLPAEDMRIKNMNGEDLVSPNRTQNEPENDALKLKIGIEEETISFNLYENSNERRPCDLGREAVFSQLGQSSFQLYSSGRSSRERSIISLSDGSDHPAIRLPSPEFEPDSIEGVRSLQPAPWESFMSGKCLKLPGVDLSQPYLMTQGNMHSSSLSVDRVPPPICSKSSSRNLIITPSAHSPHSLHASQQGLNELSAQNEEDKHNSYGGYTVEDGSDAQTLHFKQFVFETNSVGVASAP